MKEDENTASDWAKYAIAAPYNHREYSVEILKASAKIAKNNRAYGKAVLYLAFSSCMRPGRVI